MIDNYSVSNGSSEMELRLNYGIAYGKMFKTSMIKRNKILFEEIMWANDIFFSTRTGIEANIVAVDDSVIYYIEENDNSLTKNYSFDAFSVRADALARKTLYVKQNLDKLLLEKYFGGMIIFGLKSINKYGLGTVKKVYQLANVYGIPFFPSIVFCATRIKKTVDLFKYGFHNKS